MQAPEKPGTHIIPLPIESIISQTAPKEWSNVVQRVGRPGLRILREIAKYHQLTAEQLSRILDYSYRFTQLQCQLLTQEDLLYAVAAKTVPQDVRLGTLPYVYCLGPRGRRVLVEEGVAVWDRYRPSSEKSRTGDIHSIAANDVLIAATKLSSFEPSVVLSDFRDDRWFKKNPLKVRIPHLSRPVNLSPDLWLDFRDYSPRTRYCFTVEMNLSPVEQIRMRRKARDYCFSLDAYEASLGTTINVVVYFIQTRLHFPRRANSVPSASDLMEREYETEKRRKRLIDTKRWFEAELTKLGLVHEADLFRFTIAPLDTLSPPEIFFGPHFYTPFLDTPTPLIFAQEEGKSD